ncbi:MAG: restriction endonuclease [Chloroflexi bacterium]|nr:restriction endonuclease [Chloroflexota bacterium]
MYRPLLYKVDADTGRQLSKRQFAPLILAALESRSDYRAILRSIVEIAAHWSSYHLADDEFAARATVQKAREVLGERERVEAREALERETARKEELARKEHERAALFGQQLEWLLRTFDDLAVASDHQRRGYLLQGLLTRTFDVHEIPVLKSFTRNEGGEQIDGAFRLDGWYYLVECRWRKKAADIRDLDGLRGQVDRSGKQTMGLFLSIEGWSDHVPQLLKQNSDKSILLMDGYDLRSVLAGQADLHDFLVGKLSELNVRSEPHLGVTQFLRNQRG